MEELAFPGALQLHEPFGGFPDGAVASEGLRLEVKSLGIKVLEVSPGWVETDFIQKTMETTKVPSKVFKHTVTKEQVVTQAMADLSTGKKRSICGPYNRFQVFCCVHFPWLASRIWNGSLNERGA